MASSSANFDKLIKVKASHILVIACLLMAHFFTIWRLMGCCIHCDWQLPFTITSNISLRFPLLLQFLLLLLVELLQLPLLLVLRLIDIIIDIALLFIPLCLDEAALFLFFFRGYAIGENRGRSPKCIIPSERRREVWGPCQSSQWLSLKESGRKLRMVRQGWNGG